MPNRRMPSLENFRVVAIFCVILIHTHFPESLEYGGGELGILNNLAGQIWWLGVPFFFLTAGYFWGKSAHTRDERWTYFRGYISPLLRVFCLWVLIEAALPWGWPTVLFEAGSLQPFVAEAVKNFALLASNPVLVLTSGAGPIKHLWFLPALIVALGILTLLVNRGLERYLLIAAVGLYGMALAEEMLASRSLLFSFHLRTWLLATLFVGLGWWLSHRDRPSVSFALGLMFGGCAVRYAEWVFTKGVFDVGPFGHFYLGGIVFSIGFFMLALARPTFGESTEVPRLAKFNLGVYLCHMSIIYTCASFVKGPEHLFWPLGLAVVVYMLSLCLTIALSKIPIAKYLIEKTPQANANIQTKM